MDRFRIHSVDIFRGLLAVGVMLYHYSYWLPLSVPQPFLSLSHKVGIYAVESFFVLSGFSLYWAYRDRPPVTVAGFAAYLITRFLRLAPLFIFAIVMNRDIPLASVDFWRIAANFSLTLGFVDPSLSMLVGGWSIGVEMVLSVLLPFFIVLQAKMRHAFLFVVLAACVPMYFWQGDAVYVQTPNHVFFFVAGVYLGYLRAGKNAVRALHFWLGLLLMGSLFTAIGSGQTTFAYFIEGWPRAVMSVVTVIICGLFCLYEFRKIPGIFLVLTMMGEASYSIYLLHPIVFSRLRSAFGPTSDFSLYFIMSTLTVLISFATYQLLEKQILKFKPRRPLNQR